MWSSRMGFMAEVLMPWAKTPDARDSLIRRVVQAI